jgi:AcrR family transcriptional regulator
MAMAGTAPGQEHSRQRRRGRRRGSLTPELIVKESLRLLDENGLDGFSLPKLGRALGADPTAVYRHFASKDDLVLAIADELIEDAMSGLTPQACWIDTMTEVVRRLRRTYCEHPAAAWLSACRTTRRPAEMRVVDVLIGAVLEAGFEGAAAARVYRAIGDFAVYWSGAEAAFLALEPDLQDNDRAAWVRAYRAVDRADHPHIWRLREELPEVTDDAIFETTLSLVVGGLTQIAPHPCGCGRHEPQPAETDGS